MRQNSISRSFLGFKPVSLSGDLPQLALRFALGCLGLAMLLLLWALGIYFLKQNIPLTAMLSPDKTFASLYHLIGSGELDSDILASLRRVAVSLLFALLIGIPVGLITGLSKTIDNSTSAAFQFLRMVSPLSWMPVAVMIFGIGDMPIYFLLSMTAVWPIIINTSAGVRKLDPRWLNLAKSLTATKWEVLTKIILPGILGNILTGTRIAIGIIWVLLVPCEMLGVSSGLGYFILDTRDRLAYSELMAAIIIIGILGFALDGLAKKLQQRFAYNN